MVNPLRNDKLPLRLEVRGMKDEPKTAEKVEIEKQTGIGKAHTGGLANTKVEGAAKGAEEERVKTTKEAAEKVAKAASS
jgi:hypothetical protein